MERFDNFKQILFNDLTTEEWRYLLGVAQKRVFTSGEYLIKEGDTGQEVFLILQGQVAVSRGAEAERGTELLGKGSILGEMAVITNQPRSANVIAVEETQVLVLNIEAIKQDPQASALYLKIMQNLALELSKKILYLGDRLIKYDRSRPKDLERIEADNPTPPNAILVLFGWRWLDIMHEVPFLAEHGYDAIKLSPPQEFVIKEGNPWWTMYQPVSYHLSNYYGSPEDFIKLVDFCHGYKIRVLVDLVINHMAEFSPSEGENVGTNGTEFKEYSYGPLNSEQDYYAYDDFYHFGATGNKQISDNDYATLEGAWHLEHYDLLKLPKLNLESGHVVGIVRKYMQYLLSLGVDGFRLDAAKHISTRVVEKLLSGLQTAEGLRPFIYQEYYAYAPMGIDLHSFMERYFRIGYVTSFKYGEFIADALMGRGNSLQKLVEYSFGSSWIHYPENRTVTVIDNHDTERMMEHMLSYKTTQHNAYVLGYIFMLAWPFGVPKIMSSFKFKTHNDGVPASSVWQHGRFTGFDQDSKWVVQHRWNAIANMVLFRRETQSAQGIAHVWLRGNQIAFARVCEQGKKGVIARGFVVINATDQVLKERLETGLPSGRYYNLIASSLVLGQMQGPVLVVERYGYAEIEVGPFDALVIMPKFADYGE